MVIVCDASIIWDYNSRIMHKPLSIDIDQGIYYIVDIYIDIDIDIDIDSSLNTNTNIMNEHHRQHQHHQ